MNRLRLGGGLLVLICWAGTATCADTLPDAADLVRDFGGPHWYTVSMMGQRAGYVRWQAHLLDTAEGPRLRIEEHSKIYFRLETGAQEMDSHQVVDYDADLRPGSIRMWQNLMGRMSEISVEIEETHLRVTLSQPDGVHERQIPRPDDFGSGLLLMVAATSGQLGPGFELSFSAFDSYSSHMDRYLVSFDRWEDAGDGQAAVLQTRMESLGVQMESWLRPDGMIVRQSFPELMGLEMVLSTEDEALAEIVGPAFAGGIPVGSAPADPHRADRVSLLATAADGNVAELVPTTARQQIIARADGGAEIVITPQLPPTTTVQVPIAEPEFGAYLEPNELTQSDSEIITGLVADIIGQERDAWSCAQLLLQWVYGNLRKVRSEPRPLSALEVLEIGEGDCSEHAVLLATLAKAAGIPARMVVGLVYVDGTYGYHEWNELYVGQWVQMDASWGRQTVGAGHLELASSAPDREAMLSSHLAIGRTIGTLFLKFNPRQPNG